MFHKSLIQNRLKHSLNIKEFSEIVVDLDEYGEESLSGGNSSQGGNITITATGDTTSSAIALPSLLSQVNKAKQ